MGRRIVDVELKTVEAHKEGHQLRHGICNYSEGLVTEARKGLRGRRNGPCKLCSLRCTHIAPKQHELKARLAARMTSAGTVTATAAAHTNVAFVSQQADSSGEHAARKLAN
jgi:hypothetical protein